MVEPRCSPRRTPLAWDCPSSLFGLGFRRVIGAVTVIRRHSRWVTWIGAALLIMVGLALLTGAWGDFVTWLRATVGVGEVSV